MLYMKFLRTVTLNDKSIEFMCIFSTEKSYYYSNTLFIYKKRNNIKLLKENDFTNDFKVFKQININLKE